MGHLLPVEFFFYLVAHSGIDNLEYINYMYMVAVAMHGIFWFSKKLMPYVDTLDLLVSRRTDLEKLLSILHKPKVTNDKILKPIADMAELIALAATAATDEKAFIKRMKKSEGEKE